MEFDYKCDIGIPGAKPIGVMLSGKREAADLGTVSLERIRGSVVIDSARKSAEQGSPKAGTTSVKRIPKKTPNLVIGLVGTDPIQYRVHKYTRVVAPSYRTRVTIRVFSDATTQSSAFKKAAKTFNQFLKAYRAASGDPVPFVDTEENKELRYVSYKLGTIPAGYLTPKTSFEDVRKMLENSKLIDGGPTFGLSTVDFDLGPKPYIKSVALETVRLSLLPEEIKFHTDPLLEAIERAHRSQDYGMGIVMLNLSFEAALTTTIIGCLIFLDKGKAEIDKFFDDHPDLESKRQVVDDLRQQVYEKYGLASPKKFRGSGEEGRWSKSTNKKRHWGVHIVRDKDAHPLTRKDFEVALRDTQDVIRLVEFPFDQLKKARKAQSIAKPNPSDVAQ